MNDYGYCGYGGYPPGPLPRERRLRAIALGYAGLVGVVAAGVATYVLLQRLDTAVLTVIATVGCAGGVALPGLILALAVLLRQREKANGQAATLPMTPPQVVVIPPMQFQPPPTLPPGPAVQVETVQPRRFTVVGEE